VIVCPACGSENPDTATECSNCHLGVTLFVAVREAAAVHEDTDPKYLQTIGEILTQLGDEVPLSTAPAPAAEMARAHRFLAPPPETAHAAAAVAEPKPVESLPVLPPAGEVPTLIRQIEEMVQIGRRQGTDLTAFHERLEAGMLSRDRATLETLNRELFVVLAASITDEYESAVGRRNELAGLVPTSSPDVELEGARESLGLGDLAGAQRRLRHVEQVLGHLEEEWATVQILVTEADLLTTTIRELGGDPRPGLGPLAEGQRRARQGLRADAEPVLARAALALWTILNPLFQRDLARLKERLLERRTQGLPLGPSVGLLRQLAVDLRHRNFASAIMSYRGLRDALDSPPAAEPPTPGTDDPSAPAAG